MTEPRQEGWGSRTPRPLILWGGAAAVLVATAGLGVFLFRIGGAIADAFEASAHSGRPVPDMTGGIPALMMAVVALLGGLAPVFQAMNQRHVERRDQIARGQAPGPFVPPASLQMPQGDSSPAEGGPRAPESVPP